MSNFKAGDRVICISGIDAAVSLVAGKIYTVAADPVHRSWVSLKEVPGSWVVKRFKLLEENPDKLQQQIQQLQERIEELESRAVWKSSTEPDAPAFDPGPLARKRLPHAPATDTLQLNPPMHFADKEEWDTFVSAAALTYRYLRTVAKYNAQQGWKRDWSDQNQECFVAKIIYPSRQNPRRDRPEVQIQRFLSTQYLPTHYYMSQKTSKLILEEFSQEELLQIVSHGLLGFTS